MNICTKMKDAVFAEFCRTHFDMDGDGVVSPGEAAAVKEIKCPNLGIASLEGIEEFPNVEVLDVSGNPLGQLDVSPLTKLKTLVCEDCSLTSLSFPTAVIGLYCAMNNLFSLDLSQCANLRYLCCYRNSLAEIELTGTKWDAVRPGSLMPFGSPVDALVNGVKYDEYFKQNRDVKIYATEKQITEIYKYIVHYINDPVWDYKTEYLTKG